MPPPSDRASFRVTESVSIVARIGDEGVVIETITEDERGQWVANTRTIPLGDLLNGVVPDVAPDGTLCAGTCGESIVDGEDVYAFSAEAGGYVHEGCEP